MSEQVGTYEVRGPRQVTDASYECAAWWETRALKPGVYPVRRWHNFYIVTIDAVVVENNFQSLWCGNRIGKSYDQSKDAGKPTSHSIQTYEYVIKDSMKDPNSPWALSAPA